MALALERQEKEMEVIVGEEELRQQAILRTQLDPVLAEVLRFINKHRMIVYGGTALNEYLPPNLKFYDTTDLPDYDCMIPHADKYAVRIADILHKKGFEYVVVRNAQHHGTYRVFVNFVSVLDITTISPFLYRRMLEQSRRDYKKRKDLRFTMAPLDFLQHALHRELAKPVASLFRWSKVFKRFKLMEQALALSEQSRAETDAGAIALRQICKYRPSEQLVACRQACVEFARKRSLPVGGYFTACKYLDIQDSYKQCLASAVPFVEFMSVYYDSDAQLFFDELKAAFSRLHFRKIYEIQDDLVREYKNTDVMIYSSLLPPKFAIYMQERRGGPQHYLASFYDASKECYSYHDILPFKKQKISAIASTDEMNLLFWSADTMLSFLFAERLTCKNQEDAPFISQLIYPLKKYVQEIVLLKERITPVCFGNELSKEEIAKYRWEHKLKAVFYTPGEEDEKKKKKSTRDE